MMLKLIKTIFLLLTDDWLMVIGPLFGDLNIILSNTSLGENKLVRACVHCPVRLQNGCQVNISKVVLGF